MTPTMPKSYPGARWWKFDFHTHTPASKDWKGTKAESAQTWLLRCMAAELDAVVITDHNSGAWIDRLKEAYGDMKAAVDAGKALEGFRNLSTRLRHIVGYIT